MMSTNNSKCIESGYISFNSFTHKIIIVVGKQTSANEGPTQYIQFVLSDNMVYIESNWGFQISLLSKIIPKYL